MTELRFNLNDKVVSVYSKHVYVIRGISTYSYRIEYECERLSDNKRISFEEYELELYADEIFLVESVEQKNDLEAPIITTEDIAKELFGL